MNRTLLPVVCLSLSLTACSSIPTTDYIDNSNLELPPNFGVITKSAKPKVSKAKGLDALVTLNEQEQTEMFIDKSYDYAWLIVAKALALNKMDISDRNRDKGIFYVDFDAESLGEDNSGFFSYFSNDDQKSKYQLNVEKTANKIKVTAKLKPPTSDNSSTEEQEETEQIKDESALLIKALFKTIQEEYPHK